MPALPVALPLLVAAALAATASFSRRRAADGIALSTAVLVSALCVLLLVRSADGMIVYWFGGWQPRDGVALGVSFALDPVSAGLAAFASLLVSAALVFSWHHFEEVSDAFHALMLVFLASMVGFSLSGDMFNMFVFLELITVSAVALTGYEVGERPPLEGSLNFAITNTIGGFLVVSGIGLLYGRTGALNLAQIGEALRSAPPDGLLVVAFTLLVTGFLVKAAVVPFHFWLADAYAVAPTPMCMLLAGATSTLGIYAVARIYWTAFAGTFGPHEAELRAILVSVGVLTALLGAFMSFLQHHLKRLLAFATVSSIGLYLVGVGLLTPAGLAGTALFVLGDGLVKASLFVCVGVLQHRRVRLDERHLRGLGRNLPFTGAIFALGGLALAGLPPFGTFLGKAAIEEAAVKEDYAWVPVLLTLASAFAGGAALRAAGRVFLGWGPAPKHDPSSEQADTETGPEPEEAHDRTPVTMFVPAVVLLLAALVVGATPSLTYATHEAAVHFLDGRAYAAAVLREANPSVPVAEPSHVPKPEDFLYAAGSIAGLFTLALLALFGHRLPRKPPEMLVIILQSVTDRLRALHSGHPGDYVAWITVGVAALGSLFVLALR